MNVRRTIAASRTATAASVEVGRESPSSAEPARQRQRSDVLVVVAATVATTLPEFLLGALAVQLRGALHFGAGTLGLIVALYCLGASAGSIPMGGLVERFGGLHTMRVACLSSALLLLLTVAAPSWPVLAALMVPAGISSAATQVGGNVFLLRRIDHNQQGLAFGVKQAAVPLATALAGLAVPAIALTAGWRWAFAIAAVSAIASATMLPRPEQTLAQRRADRVIQPTARMDRRPLVALALGFGLGVGTATAMTTFLVSSAVASGIGRAQGGLLVALGGALAVASRILTGRQADRRGRAHLPVIAGMLTVGVLGYGLFALASAQKLTVLYLPAVAIAFTAGWGWNGLFNFTIVRTHLDQPARATAFTQVGARLGAVLGPFVFGQLVMHTSYALAWGLTGATAAGAAAMMLLGHRLLLASHAPSRALGGGG